MSKMSKFIKLTNRSGHAIYVAAESVETICQNKTKTETTVSFTGPEGDVIVKESPEEILALMGQPIIVNTEVKTPEGLEPRWDERNQGVFIPALGKLLPLHEPTSEEKEWQDAMDIAASLGQQLPTQREWHLLYYYKDAIDAILEEHGGDKLDSNYFWSSTEGNQRGAWYVSFNNGTMNNLSKYFTYTVRPLAAFKNNL